MKIDLNNKLALVAEGTSTIGKAVCAQLHESGARVVCLVPNTGDEAECQAYYKTRGLPVKVYSVDTGNFDTCVELIQEIEEELGHIDIMINNSDHDCEAAFSEMSPQQWQDSIHINLDSVYNLCRQLSEKMSERGFGRIINISSVYAKKGAPAKSAYAASKSGLHGFTMALSQELARKGVTVNTVSPGHIRNEDEQSADAAADTELLTQIPAARLGEASEVASLVDYLCSPQAGFITGADIAINGGQHIY